jgi:Asp-tRNA(Asn)/Glu-tRNA(Gln) amidotransferase A subunit family amidase
MTGSRNSAAVIFWWGVFGLSLAIAIQLLLVLYEIPVSVDKVPVETLFQVGSGSSGSRGGDDYNFVDIKAPASAGPVLKVLSYLIAKSPLAPFLLRHLLNTNGVHMIRELSAKYCSQMPPTHFPIHKASKEEMEEALAWTDSHAASVLQDGLELSRPPNAAAAAAATDPAPGYRSIMDYHKLYKSKKATPTQVMERLIQGAEHELQHLRIFACFRPELIRQQAQDSDRRWAAGTPLSVWDGVPVAIKDMSPVKGLSMCDGSSVCREMEEDDFPAERLRQAGAILVGMTVMTEGGVTPLGYAAFFDGPFNPYDRDYYSGGSSGGSAVAVASGLVPMAVGWDGGGSVRVPASMSGVLGLATTFARIPFRFPAASTNVKAGPLAATMTDIALSYLLLSESHPDSFYTDLLGAAYLPQPHLAEGVPPSFDSSTETKSSLQGTRLGVFWDHFRHTDTEVYEKCRNVVRFLEDRGAEIVNITIPHLREIHLSHGIKILTEFGIAWETPFYNKTHELEANTEITVMLGRTVTADEVLAAEKVRSLAIKYVRQALFKEMQLDAIVSPMLGGKVPKTPKGYRGFGESNTPLVYKIMRFVPLANFLGLPGLTVPVGYEETTGLPIGFQLLGDAWSEPTLIRLGCAVEQFQTRRQPPAANYFDVLGPWM